MTLLEFKDNLFTELDRLYPKNEIDSFFKLLMHYKLNYSSVDIGLNPNEEITSENLDFLTDALTALKREKPIQYILGETTFYGLSFKVNEHTLIPRPETEELVDWILKFIKQHNKNQTLNILDIGTGTGCIAISLAKYLPKATVYALDISENALQTAKQNAQLNEVNIRFIHTDILKTKNLSKLTRATPTFDIIVSNPPYVRDLEKKEMSTNVLQHEPHHALFVADNNPLLFYNKIANLASNSLSKNGQLFFEINQYLHKETVDLLKEKNYSSIEVKKDLFDHFRMIKASF